MIDFMKISTRQIKKGVTEIFPKFVLKKSSDLMIRGGDFYAVWNEDTGLWSTDEEDVINMVDAALYEYTKEQEEHAVDELHTKYMWDSNSGSIDAWHKYCQKQMRDNYHPLDEKIIFGDAKTTKKDYASKMLSYPLKECDIPGYEKLMTTLYSPEERRKIEWAIGSVIEGDSKHIQKFMVLYGSAGTGKSTVLNIIQQLFEGYYSVFDAKALGSANNSFALEAFKTNPLVAIQHDGDLSRIEDNTRLRVVNDDPNSPTSTVNRGREIIHRVTDLQLAGEPTDRQIKDYATTLLSQLSSVEYTLTYSHGYCPVRLYDCVRLNYERAGLIYSVVEIIQSMNKSLGLMISCIRLGISQWEQQELNSGWDNDIHTPHPEKLQQEYGQMSPSTICQL